MSRMFSLSFAVLLALLATVAAARAHPHVFIDTGLTLHVDAEGRLQRIEVVWVYDELTSLLALEDLGLDPDNDGVLTSAERGVLSGLAGDWGEDFDGDLRLRAGGQDLALSGPQEAAGDLVAGRVVFRHSRAVHEAPLGAVTLAAYDPTFYSFYELRPEPSVVGPAGCRVAVAPADTLAAQRLLDEALAALSDDELMNEDNFPAVGEAFADTVTLSCD